ncbi:hypothetical protein NMY22_g13962 [Coprinellus aureogranulatus]|nr:hypothetical protein NMY22_g13962 [Coprinellus aureogranulatus]
MKANALQVALSTRSSACFDPSPPSLAFTDSVHTTVSRADQYGNIRRSACSRTDPEYIASTRDACLGTVIDASQLPSSTKHLLEGNADTRDELLELTRSRALGERALKDQSSRTVRHTGSFAACSRFTIRCAETVTARKVNGVLRLSGIPAVFPNKLACSQGTAHTTPTIIRAWYLVMQISPLCHWWAYAALSKPQTLSTSISNMLPTHPFCLILS